LQHGVDQRGFAVVHVRDDGDIANAQTQKEPLLNVVYYYFTMLEVKSTREVPGMADWALPQWSLVRWNDY